MGASYGLGIVAGVFSEDSSSDVALDLLRGVAAFAFADVCDRLPDGRVVSVSSDGDVTELSGERAETVAAAIESSGNSRPYSAFAYLDGYHVMVPGAGAEGVVPDLPDDCELHVSGVVELRKKLDKLLARTDVEPLAHDLHQDLRRLCDVSVALGLPVMLGE